MIHRRFSHSPSEILSYCYSKSADVFTIRMRNNAVIHYEAKSTELFLKWLLDNQVAEHSMLKQVNAK